jgi:hypothetical protein
MVWLGLIRNDRITATITPNPIMGNKTAVIPGSPFRNNGIRVIFAFPKHMRGIAELI